MVAHLQPDYGAVIWDMGLPERRTKLQPEYKQQRAEMPSEMIPQLDFIQTLVPQLGFQSLGPAGHTEADDLIASYATAAVAKGFEVILATNDKDLFQLVDDTVKVYSTKQGLIWHRRRMQFALLGSEYVGEKWGVPPGQIGEVLCLIGDTVRQHPEAWWAQGPRMPPRCCASSAASTGFWKMPPGSKASASAEKSRPPASRFIRTGKWCGSTPTCRCRSRLTDCTSVRVMRNSSLRWKTVNSNRSCKR